MREIYQAGVEFLGVSTAFSDAQAIAFAIDCLLELGVKDFIVDVGHVGFFKGLLEDCGLDEETVEAVRLYVNAKDSINAQALLKKHGAKKSAVEALSALPTLFGGVEVLTRAEKYTDNPTALAALTHLKKVYELLKAFGLEKYVSFDLGTVKDLSYYSGVVFTGLTKSLGSPVLSGGRYDNLADDFAKHVPAVGFAMGLKRILIALERQGDLLPLPTDEVTVCAKPGFEAAAYQAYISLTKEGKAANLYAGEIHSEEEAKALKKSSAAEVLFASEKGVKSV
ncbi:MAG: ATP phosphoribosyltransferase regulatory subunit [Clostridia bacterium]|nr:ATP phosphoribosyltransferase regulatory subunit [Clostridia bacterium]